MRPLPPLALLLLLGAGGASAAEFPCGAVDPGVIEVDGYLDDWGEVSGPEAGGRNAGFSFTARCNFDEQDLYLAIEVRDDHLLRLGPLAPAPPRAAAPRGKRRRHGHATAATSATDGTPGAAPLEDHLELVFAEGETLRRLVIHPSDRAHDLVGKVAWSDGAATDGLVVSDSAGPVGWTVEVALPWARVPGWSPGAPSVRLAVAAFDVDRPGARTVAAALSTAPLDAPEHLGEIHFPEAEAVLAAFLDEHQLTPRELYFDRAGRVLPGGVPGRVVIGPGVLAVLGGEEATTAELPIGGPDDLMEARLMDLAGDGHDAIVVRHRVRVDESLREILAIYRMGGRMGVGGLHRIFAMETARAEGGNRLASGVHWVRRARGTDLVVEALRAVGWTEATYPAPPPAAAPSELSPSLLPWSAERKARFQFAGDTYTRVD